MEKLRIINIEYFVMKELEQGFSNIGRVISGDKDEVYYQNTYSDEDITMKLFGNSAEELYNWNKHRYVFTVYNNVETSEEIYDIVSGFIYIISGGFIYNLKLNEVRTEKFEAIDCYSYFAIYELYQVIDIRETGFYKKAPLLGGIDAMVQDVDFVWNKELIEKLINEGKNI